ncbi:O-methyltransferase [Melia azedarach]|uniref:O-methyltransferase n=1 Tax=Melia azedarach TaxID=155640 RepID=A0ACC1YKV0_MELAZ|nr:O-methyltransferase [Melia azedarach]
MYLIYRENDSELLQAHAHVWNQIYNFINSMSLKCAVQLGIPDIISKHGKPMTLDELVTALPIHPTKSQYIYRLMRILLHSGVFSLQIIGQEEAYVLTKASQLLVEDNPLTLKPFLLAALNPALTTPWCHLSTWFQNDDPTPFATVHGMTLWDFAGHEPKFNGFFNEAMASDARLVASVVLHKCKDVFKGLNTLVDVGGGTGTMAKAIAKEFPQTECTVFDLKHVVADLKGDGNLKYVGGDMFEAIPPADALLLKWVLHDWNDEECVKILKKCKEAITSNGKVGKVIIIDMMRENKKGDDESIETQLFFDMLMMVLLNGKERDEKEWAKLFQEAGFSDYKINPILGLRSLIEIYP